MLSLSSFEKFREDYYKDKWPGQRLGQAFMHHNRGELRPNPLLYYDPDNARAEGYIRRHYVPKVVHTWEWRINYNHQYYMITPEVEVIKIQLLMSESFHQLFNVTSGDYGSAMPHSKVVQVPVSEHSSSFFLYSNFYPCGGDLLYCEVVE